MRIRLQYPGFIIDYHTGEQLKTSNYTSALPPVLSLPFSTEGDQSFLYVVDSRHFSLIPDEFYDPNYHKDYLVQLGMSSDCPTGVSYIPSWKGYLVYSQENIPPGEELNCTIHSVWEGLFEYAYNVLTDDGQLGLFVHITPNQIYLIGGDPEKLQFFNSFNVRDPLDCLYFILQAIDRIKVGTIKIPVWLSGQFAEDSPLYRLLEQYIVHLAKAPGVVMPLKGLESTPPHQYGDLSSFAACVSSAAN
ncbi:MAG: DUF3822 family protein [Saprospiraceae bacterium]|nr:DUF3822 family protein [Saprospiraceae bacterium]